MTDFNGMNGTLVFVADEVEVGTVPGAPYGYQSNLPVTVSIRLERLQRRPVYETVDHEQVVEPLDFALTTAVWQPRRGDIVAGGATVEPLTELVAYADGITADIVGGLAWLHHDFHLNAMQAGCAHQTVIWEDEPYRRPSLRLTQDCPITSYQYGHSWLVKLLPDDILTELRGLLADVDQSAIYDPTKEETHG